MNVVVPIFIALLFAILVAFAVMAGLSRSGMPPGLENGRLAACPNAPNCVSSEEGGPEKARIAPIPLPELESAIIQKRLRERIREMGGEIRTQTPDYTAATFTTNGFGFVDDLETRIDPDARLLHIRSASRVGYSDFGANRKRVEQLRLLVSGIKTPE